jgi:hypothetical protein
MRQFLENLILTDKPRHTAPPPRRPSPCSSRPVIASQSAHADGNGFKIQLETVTLGGRIALRIASEKTNNQLGHSNGWRVEARLPFVSRFFRDRQSLRDTHCVC